MLRTMIKKEILDLKRDRKLLLGTIVLPFVLLPLIGIILYASIAVSPPVIEIINYNQSNLPYIQIISNYITRNGGTVIYNNTNTSIVPDAVIIFPNDFNINASNISRQTFVYEKILISSNQEASNLVNNAIGYLSYTLVYNRIERLINSSNLQHVVNPDDVINPLLVKNFVVTITGRNASQSQANLSEMARIITLVLFPSATPVIFYVTDGIVGEKERKTLESLLASPISINSFIFSKVIIAVILGVLSSLGDILGIVIFSSLMSFTFGLPLSLSTPFILIVILTYLLAVLLTAALSVILLLALGGSMRNMQVINFLILSFGLIASFSALFINVANLQSPLNLVLLIPYEQLSLSLLYFVSGSTFVSLSLLLGVFAVCVIILIVSSRLFNSERLLLK
ncbi:ABC transporter permease [Saccharolobus solfataricus]|nr:ABC transporter permease [Saccharolobus solfataricus]AKA74987.1 ABC transporter permease [Saccharolobus solfataricus]AKA75341.1 ABC transporter permease [Saccharolobus solfataricus]AKA80372.1 ABC transporter permease [Saccharolobus solfataricus]AZF67154.1 ABC transporter permease [Saccharolobus solfataricus]AZF69774.1 ABC transporter permease [Saccharolobus solfataricus]